jgi:predicted RNA binding protein YcfA (HicA-like mRNA interferase family)
MSRVFRLSNLTVLRSGSTLEGVTARKLLQLLKRLGCSEIRQRGSHLIVRCGKCQSTVPVHQGEDIGRGLLRSIERDLEPCLGKGWLSK